MIVSPRLGPRPTGSATWLALGARAIAALREQAPPGSRIRRAASVHEAVARLVRERIDACLVDAAVIHDRPRAALRALRRHAGEAPLFVLRAAGAERSLRAAEALGIPVADDAKDLVAAARPRGDAGLADDRASRTAGAKRCSFPEGLLRRIERPAALGPFVLRAFAMRTHAGRASLLLRETGRGTLCVRAAIGLPEGLVDQVRCASGAGIAGRAASLGRPLLGEGARGGPRGYDGAAYLVLPLVAAGSPEGVVCLSGLPEDQVPDEEALRRLVRMARQAARAFRAARRLQRAESLMARDRLTSLPNRRAFDRALSREMERARRSGAPLAVALLDLDRFKRVNDSLGHPAGDRVLVEAARRLRVALRESDLVARYGGEEFGVLLTGLAGDPVTESQRILARLRQAIRAVAIAPGRGAEPVWVTMSLGFTVFTPRTGDLREAAALLQAADRALYRAKASGRDNVQGPDQ